MPGITVQIEAEIERPVTGRDTYANCEKTIVVKSFALHAWPGLESPMDGIRAHGGSTDNAQIVTVPSSELTDGERIALSAKVVAAYEKAMAEQREACAKADAYLWELQC